MATATQAKHSPRKPATERAPETFNYNESDSVLTLSVWLDEADGWHYRLGVVCRQGIWYGTSHDSRDWRTSGFASRLEALQDAFKEVKRWVALLEEQKFPPTATQRASVQKVGRWADRMIKELGVPKEDMRGFVRIDQTFYDQPNADRIDFWAEMPVPVRRRQPNEPRPSNPYPESPTTSFYLVPVDGCWVHLERYGYRRRYPDKTRLHASRLEAFHAALRDMVDQARTVAFPVTRARGEWAEQMLALATLHSQAMPLDQDTFELKLPAGDLPLSVQVHGEPGRERAVLWSGGPGDGRKVARRFALVQGPDAVKELAERASFIAAFVLRESYAETEGQAGGAVKAPAAGHPAGRPGATRDLFAEPAPEAKPTATPPAKLQYDRVMYHLFEITD